MRPPGVLVELVLSAVAMVNIPVYYKNPGTSSNKQINYFPSINYDSQSNFSISNKHQKIMTLSRRINKT